MKTIKKIAKNAGYACDADRHGCYTDYTLTKGERVLRIEHTAPRKNLLSGYLFMANGPINHNIEGADNYQWEKPAFGVMTHALAKDGNWLYLTLEQVETLIKMN